MKTKQALIIGLVVVGIGCFAGVFGYLMLNTIRHSGAQAVAQMNTEEREWLERIKGIDSSMNKAQVYEVLGKPTSDIFLIAKWDSFGGSQLSQLRVYFYDKHPRRIRWFKLGYFVYEEDL